MRSHFILAACLCAATFPASASAQEIVLGFGYTDFPDDGVDNGIFSLEYRHTPFYERNVFSASFAGNVSTTTDRDIFLGAGISLRWAWESNWFADFSLMPGYFDEGTSGNDLGHDLEFRSLLAVGYQFDTGHSLSLGITHKSNASISETNPGADAVLLRWHVPLGS